MGNAGQRNSLHQPSRTRSYCSHSPLQLSCTYCNEFDDFSKPVPAAEMLRRIDHLADLGTSIITFSGGEPCCIRNSTT